MRAAIREVLPFFARADAGLCLPAARALCVARNFPRVSGPAKGTKSRRPGRRPGPTGTPVARPFLPGAPKVRALCQNRPRATRRDFRQPASGFNFCLWVWHAAKASLEGRRDAARTTAERLLRSPADAPQWSLLPGKSNLGCPRQSSLPSIQEKSCFARDPTPSTKRFI